MSPFAWQSNKAIFFYFIQNSVSEIQFGTWCTEAELSASDALKRMTVAGRKREDLKTSIVELFISITLLLTLDSARPQGVSLSKVISKKVIGKGSPSERDKWLLKVNSE